MASMSGHAKLQRAANQLENAERLLLSLPKHFYKDPVQRDTLEKLAKEIFLIKKSVENEIAVLEVKNKWSKETVQTIIDQN